MVEVKQGPLSDAERIAARLRNSGEGLGAHTTVKTGDGARRTFHNIHRSGSQHVHGGMSEEHRDDYSGKGD